jgi:hypothetical protein
MTDQDDEDPVPRPGFGCHPSESRRHVFHGGPIVDEGRVFVGTLTQVDDPVFREAESIHGRGHQLCRPPVKLFPISRVSPESHDHEEMAVLTGCLGRAR